MANNNQSNDKFLQNNPKDINDEYAMKKKQKLPQDYETPFSEPQNTKELISKDAQQADPRLDSHEIYDEGFSSATEKKVNNQDETIGYDDDEDIPATYDEYDEVK
jgi:hypothetical protein